MSTSPTKRSLELLRKRGYLPAIVEKWNAHSRIRQDLFGFMDLLAIGKDILGVQTTSRANFNARVKKCLESPLLPRWFIAGGKLEIHGWSKKGARGKRKTWQVHIQVITKKDLGWGG